MRRKGVDEAWSALEEMQHQGVTTDKYTVSRMLMRTVGESGMRPDPARAYRGIALVERFIDMQPADVDEVLFNALLDTCCRLKDLGRLEATVNRMRELNVTPSPVTLGILVKTYGQAGDLQKVLQAWEEMEKQRGQANAVTYGCMIDACVKCGNLAKAVDIFKGMRKAGKHRNTILYTTLIKGYGLEKDLASALELFHEMPREGVPYNTITYNSILEACVKCGDLGSAEGLLREMTAPGSALEPDLITFSTLLKGYCHVGDLDKALQVVEAIKARGLRCDELVYNTLMDGCVKASDATAGVGLFEEMVQSGLRPSAITHSILARLFQRAGYEDEASEAVAQLYQHHGIERPSGCDRGKGSGRRGAPRGLSNRHGCMTTACPPSAGALRRERSDSAATESGWSAWGGPHPSEPSTPLASPLQSPLPIEQMGVTARYMDPMRGLMPGMSMPGSATSETFSSSRCSEHPTSGSATGPAPAGALPMQGRHAAQALPPWPFSGPAAPLDVLLAGTAPAPVDGEHSQGRSLGRPPLPFGMSAPPPHDIPFGGHGTASGWYCSGGWLCPSLPSGHEVHPLGGPLGHFA